MKQVLTTSVAVGLLLAFGAAAQADWDPGDGHKMHFPQLPDANGWDVGFGSLAGALADDWQCSRSGPVEDIHMWVSWKGYSLHQPKGKAQRANLTVNIRADIPDPDGGGPLFSMPGAELWTDTFDPNEYSMRFAGTGDQGWYDPSLLPADAIEHDHTTFFQINIVEMAVPFEQQAGTIYWLEVFCPDLEMGWKTSQDHWNDDAVCRHVDTYSELYDPLVTTESLDLAFVITPEPATMSLLGLGALGLIARRKRSDCNRL